MKSLILICTIGTICSLIVLSEADPLPNPDVQDGQNDISGIPAALIAEKQLKLFHELSELVPHSRVKRSKKKVVVINQYYGGNPQGYGGYSGHGGHGGYPRQYGGYSGGYQPYGYQQQPYYDNHHGGDKGGKLFKKLKKFG